jgi:hypothetical protein
MQVGFFDLTVWSFLMASAHGAGFMVLPFVLGVPADVAAAASEHAGHVVARDTGVPWTDAMAVAVHTLTYLLVTALVVWLNVPVDAARRILARLASSGVVRKYRPACSCAAHYLVNSPCGADRSVVHLDRCFTFTITEPLRGPSRRPEEQIG